MTASAQEFFEKHDNSKYVAQWENTQFVSLKYLFELMEEYASLKTKELKKENKRLKKELSQHSSTFEDELEEAIDETWKASREQQDRFKDKDE